GSKKMPDIIATVVSISGDVLARDAEGNLRSLNAGDALFEGESLVTPTGGRAELLMTGGESLEVGPEQAIKLTQDLSEAARPDQTDAQVAQGAIEQVIQALNEGENLDEILEAPAAGLAGGGGGEGSNFVRLLRISEE